MRVPVTITRSPLVPNGVRAWVPLRRTIVVAPGTDLTEHLLAHELKHVEQAELHPWPAAYVWQWVRTGFNYTRMPFEVAARHAEGEPFYRAWARDLLEDGVP